MNILSLFDGISCGRVALERAGVPVDLYMACEVDKYAVQIARKNYPDTVHMGDVRHQEAALLPRVDVLIGGSPCQGFSMAGRRKGAATAEGVEVTSLEQYLELKADGFEFDGQSYLVWEYVRLLRDCKPRYFLLENVRMPQKWQDVITEALGVPPVMINSALVSAQRRERWYWTNIPGVSQPEDKGLVLRDVMETETDQPLRPMEELVGTSGAESSCRRVGTATDIKGHDSIKRVYSRSAKAPTLTTMGGGHREPKVAVSRTQYRKLTPTECERLQTLEDGYTEGVSNTQRYKALGNGWTGDVISHILKGVE